MINDNMCNSELPPFGCWCDPADITYSHPNGSLLLYRGEKVRKIVKDIKQIAIIKYPNENDGFYIKWPHPTRKRTYLTKKILFSEMEHI